MNGCTAADERQLRFTQCYVSLGDPDGEDSRSPSATPMEPSAVRPADGDWRITVFDQWNDML